FMNLPYWTTDYVHLGPFRLIDYGQGENVVFSRFDSYFRGRPAVERIVIRAFNDANILLASVKAADVDVLAERALAADVYLDQQDEWRRSGGGQIMARQDNWSYVWFQFDPRWAQPIEISQDVRIRRGLIDALDRDGLRDFLFRGLPLSDAN